MAAAEVSNGKEPVAAVADAAAEKKEEGISVGGKCHYMTPSLIVEAPRCQEAIEWYVKVFGFRQAFIYHDEKRKAEQEAPLVMHAQLKLGDKYEIFVCDEVRGEKRERLASSTTGTPMYFHFGTDDADALFAKAVECGATVTEKMEDQFWGQRFGRILDPFGYEWGIAHDLKNFTMNLDATEKPSETVPDVKEVAAA